jgi:cyclomaltodextrinase / maltogenic alpha-amylase / neopullulanase
MASGSIFLTGGDSDVWAWQRDVRGQITDLNCKSITINSNQESVTAHIEGDRFSATVPIAEGENRLTATCHQSDGAEVASEPVVYTGRLRRVPVSTISISLDGRRIVLDGSSSQPTEQDGSAVQTFTWTVPPDNPAPLQIVEPAEFAGKPLEGSIQAKRLVLDAPSIDGEYFVSLTISDKDGRSDRSTTYFTVSAGQPVLANWDTENTAWVENAVVYGVIPRMFSTRGLQGVTDRLDYLKDLGINALWFSPINLSPGGDYGYAVVDYFAIGPRHGKPEDFRQLVQEAHKRGIRVLMDFVPNHSSASHPYFLNTLRFGQDSPYWNFYDRDEQGMFTHYFDWAHLPNLNYENPEVRRWMLEAFSFWVREFDVDGFRVDVAWGIRERRPDFWPEWRKTLKRIKPDLLLLAEATARDDFYFTNGFDAGYDWTSQLGHWAWELVFQKQNLLTYNLNAALTNIGKGFHPDALIFRFINNNDTAARFITRHGLGMTRVAAALLLTLPGIPCIFTGEELGAEYEPYRYTGPIMWDDKLGLHGYYKKLITLRRQVPSLHSRHWTILEVEPHVQVYGYMRHLADNSEPVIVLLNFSDEDVEAVVPIPDVFRGVASKLSFRDLLSGETLVSTGDASLVFPIAAKRALILDATSAVI